MLCHLARRRNASLASVSAVPPWKVTSPFCGASVFSFVKQSRVQGPQGDPSPVRPCVTGRLGELYARGDNPPLITHWLRNGEQALQTRVNLVKVEKDEERENGYKL